MFEQQSNGINPPNATRGDDQVAVKTTYEEMSVTNWPLIIILCFWFFGLILLANLVYVVIRSHRKRGIVDTAKNEEDVEEQENKDRTERNPSLPTSKNAIAIPLLAAVTAFCLSVWMHVSCEFLDVGDTTSSLLTIGIWESKYRYLSNIYVGGDDTCYSNFPGSSDYDDFPDVRLSLIPIDGALVTSMIGAVIASVFGGIALVILVYFCLSSTFPISRVRLVAFLLWIVTLAQALTLAVLATRECKDRTECYVGFGAVASCTAIFFWLLSALGTSLVPL